MGVHRACFFIARAGRAATPERNRSGNQPPILCILPLVAHQLASARNDFTVQCPTGSGQQMNLYQVAEEISRRLANIFLKDKDGQRPVYRGTRKFQEDPHWRDCLQFYEYFHGDNGAGLAPTIRPAGRVSSPGQCTCLRPSQQSRSSKEARRPISRRKPNRRLPLPPGLANLRSRDPASGESEPRRKETSPWGKSRSHPRSRHPSRRAHPFNRIRHQRNSMRWGKACATSAPATTTPFGKRQTTGRIPLP